MKEKIKKIIKRISLRLWRWRVYKGYRRQYKDFLAKNQYENTKLEGEDQYIQLWKQLSPRVEPYSYRFYSHYMDKPLLKYVIPEDICRTIIEYYLNPSRYKDFYSDKNTYKRYISKQECLPRTLLCRINGSNLLNEKFEKASVDFLSDAQTIHSYMKDYQRVVLKPSVDSESGRNVLLLTSDGTVFKDSSGATIGGQYLKTFGNDFVVQEALTQHPYLAQFNESSVNTLRLFTYRSVVTEEVSVNGALIRIGGKGNFVDNAHAGGRFVGIDVKTGILQKKTLDQYGTVQNIWNDIDFSTSEFQIPYWDKVCEFAKYVSSQIRHCRIIQLDITIDNQNNPRLIELNIGSFSLWLFMMTNQTIFGDEMQSVIDYCKVSLEEDKNKGLV